MGIAVIVALLGTVLVAVGGLLFLPQAPQLPVLGAGDWPKLIVIYLGAGWSLLGAVQFLRHGQGRPGKAVLGLLMLLSLAGAGGVSWWVLSFSYQLPAPAQFAAEKPIPAFELRDQDGNTVSDASLRGKPVVLIFGRGVW
ncbi:MAG: hypothetical protein H6841_05870 [Planctomycetes bacterium]|nr:hypothetical protein [Planctomycetota bacterium]MCB9934317.1 hypothetical protein [Planctomycetota bacterium]